jgi:hypothetical protein
VQLVLFGTHSRTFRRPATEGFRCRTSLEAIRCSHLEPHRPPTDHGVRQFKSRHSDAAIHRSPVNADDALTAQTSMQKVRGFLGVGVAIAVALAGCRSASIAPAGSARPPAPGDAVSSDSTIVGTYAGTLPCADCRGIHTTLT